MKMKITALFTLPLLILILSSCIVTSENIVKEYSCDDFSGNPTGLSDDFTVETGDKITVKLCSNSTTGFQWDYEMSGDESVKEEDHDFEEPEGDMVGAAGIEVWTFEATEKGTAVISMEYSQPWEGGLKKEWIYTMTITVE
ncbi:MAG TPA: protease inhibitor I42 family protein [Dehalococcoidia bacterium]|nr:protease inhibitor I42 family protein [Dehalococcoidia bacterium]